MSLTWNESWGSREDYEVLPDRDGLGALKIGDEVEVIDDNDEVGIYTGETGIVLGVTHQRAGLFFPVAHDCLVVAFEGMDPTTIPEDVAADLLEKV